MCGASRELSPLTILTFGRAGGGLGFAHLSLDAGEGSGAWLEPERLK